MLRCKGSPTCQNAPVEIDGRRFSRCEHHREIFRKYKASRKHSAVQFTVEEVEDADTAMEEAPLEPDHIPYRTWEERCAKKAKTTRDPPNPAWNENVAKMMVEVKAVEEAKVKSDDTAQISPVTLTGKVRNIKENLDQFSRVEATLNQNFKYCRFAQHYKKLIPSPQALKWVENPDLPQIEAYLASFETDEFLNQLKFYKPCDEEGVPQHEESLELPLPAETSRALRLGHMISMMLMANTLNSSFSTFNYDRMYLVYHPALQGFSVYVWADFSSFMHGLAGEVLLPTSVLMCYYAKHHRSTNPEYCRLLQEVIRTHDKTFRTFYKNKFITQSISQ